ncbi:MAG TPA: TRAP transporter small permease [Burkholderiales bacterium]|nr:TRAP transporter small permease [Burkholderiales bacterium]
MNAAATSRGAWWSRLDRALGWAEGAFIGAALAFTSALLFANVILRYLFLAPINWAEELTLYLMVWIVFIGGSMAVRTRGHIAIDLLPLVLTPANRRRLAIGVALAALAFFAVFLWYSGEHVLRVRGSGQLTPVMGAPMWLTYLSMPAGSFLMGLRTVQFLVRTLKEKQADGAHLMDLHD